MSDRPTSTDKTNSERAFLRQQFELLDTEELLGKHRRGGLTDIAAGVLDEVLNERGIGLDQRTALARAQYQESGDAARERLAGLGSRLGAQVLDSTIAFALAAAVIFLFRSAEGGAAVIAALATWLGYNLLSDGLPSGQSIGKRLLAIAVVDSRSGVPCRYWQSALRNLPLLFLGPIDWFFIFGESRRRLGDRIARTEVVRTLSAHEYGQNAP